MHERFKSLLVLLFASLPMELGALGPHGQPSKPAHLIVARAKYATTRTRLLLPTSAANGLREASVSAMKLQVLSKAAHLALPEGSRGYSVTAFSQLGGTGQLLASSSKAGILPLPIRNVIEATNRLAQLRNPNALPILVTSNVIKGHAEGVGEHFAEAHGGFVVVRQSSNRPACLSCATRQNTQGIGVAKGFATGRRTKNWSSPATDPAVAALENAAHQRSPL